MSTLNNVSENTTAILISGMMKDRLVTRARDGEDKRKWIVRLTPRATRLRADLLPYAAQVNDIAAKGISKSDLATCLAVLKLMSANLEQAMKDLDPDAGSVGP
jgi:DNA-binding MarR family transcriptional regulator